MACAKVAVSRLIIAIEPKRPLRLACYALEIVFGLWAATSIFAVAFQCDLPHPWILAHGRCLNLVGASQMSECVPADRQQRAVYFYIGAMNILTDLVLTVLPIPLLWGIRLKPSKKLLVVGLFGTRIL